MNKEKFAQIKAKIKRHAPILIGSGLVITTAVLTLTAKHLFDEKTKTLLEVTDEDWNAMQLGGGATYNLSGEKYFLAKENYIAPEYQN